MPCNCGRRNRSDARRTGTYEVWVNGSPTGRSFTTASAAAVYAESVNGEVVKT